MSVTSRQQICPSGQSLFSSHACWFPAQVAVTPRHDALVPEPRQHSWPGTAHCEEPHSTFPGSHASPPVGPTHGPASCVSVSPVLLLEDAPPLVVLVPTVVDPLAGAVVVVLLAPGPEDAGLEELPPALVVVLVEPLLVPGPVPVVLLLEQ